MGDLHSNDVILKSRNWKSSWKTHKIQYKKQILQHIIISTYYLGLTSLKTVSCSTDFQQMTYKYCYFHFTWQKLKKIRSTDFSCPNGFTLLCNSFQISWLLYNVSSLCGCYATECKVLSPKKATVAMQWLMVHRLKSHVSSEYHHLQL